jgi:hypothetical protein
MQVDQVIWFVLASGVLALLYGYVQVQSILKASPGNERMQEVAAAIQEGANAYLRRQYTTIGWVGLGVTLLVLLVFPWVVAVGFVIGAVLSGVAGYIGMIVSVRANVRTTEASQHGLDQGLSMAFNAGAVTGMLVVGFALLGVAGYYFALRAAGEGSDSRGHSAALARRWPQQRAAVGSAQVRAARQRVAWRVQNDEWQTGGGQREHRRGRPARAAMLALARAVAAAALGFWSDLGRWLHLGLVLPTGLRGVLRRRLARISHCSARRVPGRYGDRMRVRGSARDRQPQPGLGGQGHDEQPQEGGYQSAHAASVGLAREGGQASRRPRALRPCRPVALEPKIDSPLADTRKKP